MAMFTIFIIQNFSFQAIFSSSQSLCPFYHFLINCPCKTFYLITTTVLNALPNFPRKQFQLRHSKICKKSFPLILQNQEYNYEKHYVNQNIKILHNNLNLMYYMTLEAKNKVTTQQKRHFQSSYRIIKTFSE